ncbi:metallophosphoesterase family protein [Granulicella aggregans]|jgi:predicted phosphodiesterase|uniref:metallophosphoesterase family protein n=1 Tax=Granulicella aggregans TaxID=474949 RepID=UPI0021DFC714|nr:metallophosphoesterase family protein [Granulicella aggregans]
MRALVLSDIHGNLEALTAVLDAAGVTDQLWNLGDVVGYGGSPNQVIDKVRPLSSLVVRGNHDRVCCGLASAVGFNPVARAAAMWTQSELTPVNLEWLKALPQGPILPHYRPHYSVIDSGIVASIAGEAVDEIDLDVSCVHGSPLNEDQYILSMRDAWAPLQQMVSDVTFFGHTHVQGGFSSSGSEWKEIRPAYRSRKDAESWTVKLSSGSRHLINPGSVGQPRDFDWRAAFAIYDFEASEVTYHRVPYDLTSSQGRILMAGLPERLAARLREGR